MKITSSLVVAALFLAACAGPRAAGRGRTSDRAPARMSASRVQTWIISRNPVERAQAINAFSRLENEQDRRQVFESLYTRLSSPDTFRSASVTLAALGEPVVPWLEEKFRGAERIDRYHVAQVLSQMPPTVRSADDLMRSALRDSDLYVRYCAAMYLALRTTHPDAPVIDALIGAVNNEKEAWFQIAALNAFANSIVPRSDAIAPVVRALERKDRFVMPAAYATLKKWVPSIETQEAVEKLTASEDSELRAIAAVLLAQTLDDRTIDTSGVEAALNSPHDEIRVDAERILGEIDAERMEQEGPIDDCGGVDETGEMPAIGEEAAE